MQVAAEPLELVRVSVSVLPVPVELARAEPPQVP
jgi:hypothetical protein